MSKKTAQQREADVLAKINEGDPQRRGMEVVGVDMERRTVELAFSSEAEVRRWFGIEILSHDEGACDLTRLSDGAALLDNHDWYAQRGVVEKAWIDAGDRRGRALVRFSKSASAEELLQDVADKIKRHVSVGYRVLAIKLVEEREDVDVYMVTRWEPYEISIVSVPADTSVGVGRNADTAPMVRDPARTETPPVPPTRDASTQLERTETMKEKTLRDASGNLVRAMVDETGKITEVLEVIERAGDSERAHAQRGHDSERARVRALTEAAGAVQSVDNVDALLRTALAEGHDLPTFQRALLGALNERANAPLNEQARGADIGLTDAEARQFSVLRVVRSLMDPADRNAREAAAFEFEASRAAADKAGKSVDKFMIPTDVLRQSVRALNTGVGGNAANGGTGGNLVATDLMSGSFIEVLRNRATIMKNGRVIAGLVGNVDIPKQLAAAQGYWLGEDEDTTETGMEFGQIPLSPKTVGAFTEYTRRMAMQSSLDVEAMLRLDLASALALTIDRAGYYGTGSDHQPKGIANYTGINAVEFAAGLPTFTELVAMETAIAADNADVNSMRYAGNAAFRGHCKTTPKFGAGTEATIWEPGGTVNGYGVDVTNQVNAGDVFHGNFADLLIAMWGGLELQVDPFSGSKKGRIRIVVFQDVDFALRRVESFALGRQTVAQGGGN